MEVSPTKFNRANTKMSTYSTIIICLVTILVPSMFMVLDNRRDGATLSDTSKVDTRETTK